MSLDAYPFPGPKCVKTASRTDGVCFRLGVENSSMARQAREAMASETLSVVADRGYFKSEKILACHNAGITAYVLKPMT